MNPFIFFLIAMACLALGVISYNAWVARRMSKNLSTVERDPKTGIMKGAEPIFLKGDKDTACLLIHGFIGSPTDFGRLPKLLHQAGLTVSVPLLPGHGTDPRNFSKVSPEELIQSVTSQYEELKRKYKRVVLGGLSMGGALSLIAAAENQVDSLILLAPYLKITHQWYYALPTEWYQQIFEPFIPYVYRMACFKQVFNREAIPNIIDYDYVPLKGAKTGMVISARARRIGKVSAPTLIIHSKKDRATDYRCSQELARKLNQQSNKLVLLERSNHLILWDYEAEQVEKEILDFIQPGGQK